MRKDRVRILATSGRRAIAERITKTAEGSSELLELSLIKEGEPITKDADVVYLDPIQDSPKEYDLTPLCSGSGHKGPAHVATKTYRKNFTTIFGSKKSSSLN